MAMNVFHIALCLIFSQVLAQTVKYGLDQNHWKVISVMSINHDEGLILRKVTVIHTLDFSIFVDFCAQQDTLSCLDTSGC